MRWSRSYEMPGRPDRLLRLLRDPGRLVAALPGADASGLPDGTQRTELRVRRAGGVTTVSGRARLVATEDGLDVELLGDEQAFVAHAIARIESRGETTLLHLDLSVEPGALLENALLERLAAEFVAALRGRLEQDETGADPTSTVAASPPRSAMRVPAGWQRTAMAAAATVAFLTARPRLARLLRRRPGTR